MVATCYSVEMEFGRRLAYIVLVGVVVDVAIDVDVVVVVAVVVVVVAVVVVVVVVGYVVVVVVVGLHDDFGCDAVDVVGDYVGD